MLSELNFYCDEEDKLWGNGQETAFRQKRLYLGKY